MNFRRLTWITDPHLNFVDMCRLEEFAEKVIAQRTDALLITGDISESEDVAWQLCRLNDLIGKPLFFVLGNHDFYHGSIIGVREKVRELCEQHPQLHYLTSGPCVQLSQQWTLCGDDGWADGRLGDYAHSPVQLNDYQLIEDLVDLNADERLKRIRRLGLSSAVRLHQQLEVARLTSNHSIVMTHIPPFRESCLYEGRIANDDWAPFFTCHAVGWMLRRFCQRYPMHRVLVLCGHSHHESNFVAADNLLVRTGGAKYAHPSASGQLDLNAPPVNCLSTYVELLEKGSRE